VIKPAFEADQKQVLSPRLASRFFGQQPSKGGGAIASLTTAVHPPLDLELSSVE